MTSHSQAVTRHDFWRASYATMLAEIPPGQIAEFFTSLPMTLRGKCFSQAELLEHLWGEKSEIPLAWNYDAVNALEDFLVQKGHDAVAFIRKMLFRSNKSTYMPGKIVMSWVYPIMDTLFNVYDPREMIFQMIAIYTENYLPGHIHPRIKKAVVGDWTHSYLMYYSREPIPGYPHFNFDYIAGEQIKSFPRMLNLPEFEEISYIADARNPEEVLGRDGFARTTEGLLFEGRLIALPSRFHAFAREQGLETAKYGLPDSEILIATEDIECPRRRRVVIHKGCAYNSPGFISMIRHRKIGRKEKKFLEPMLHDALIEGALFSSEVGERHARLVASLRKRAVFAFQEADESMDLNGVHLIKGIPAKILKLILMAYVRDGRTEFEYREFKRAEQISLGQKNSNFEVRFYRLISVLSERCPEVRIHKLDRGRFAFIANCPVELKS